MNPSDEQRPLPEGGYEPAAQSNKEPPPPEPPRGKEGHRARNLLFLILLIVALGEGVYIFLEQLKGSGKSGSQTGTATSERKILYWQDPMHPQYTSDKPGKAPDCGMDLVPVYADEAKPAAKAGERRVLYWQDPMNPQNHYDKAGKAPDGMDLAPVYAEEKIDEGSLPEGAFKVTPDKQQLIGVQYAEVGLQSLTKTIRAVATLTYDETKIARVHAKIEGWIDKVFVDFTGQLVKKGQPLLSIYSPELVSTQDEYLLALRARDKLGSSSYKEVVDGAGSLLAAARKRLELWDVSDEQIAEVEKTRAPIKDLTLYSPVNGFVTARNSYEKQRITLETELYAIADLSTVWAIADFYEYEARDVRIGQGVVLTVASFPGRTFRSKVTYIYPQLDSSTRTLRVRVELPNPDFNLKPDMYANAELKIDYGRRLAIPQEGVLDSGAEQLVFVALDGGYFEPRKVQLGDKVDNQVIILSGLKAGERIVTSGNFLIDSESKLKSAASGMGMPEMRQGTESQNQPRQSTERPNSKPAPADHSMPRKGMEEPKKEDPMSHSNHVMEPENSRHD
jgi:membrane fusion protein, copper/silver efflux system